MTLVFMEMLSSSNSSMAYHRGSLWPTGIHSLYTTPIGDILRQFELCYHIYADDIQINTSYNGLQLAKMKKSIPDNFPAIKFIGMKQLV